MTKLLPKTTGRYWTLDGWHVGPPTSWRIEWYTLDRDKCTCEGGFDSEYHDFGECCGYREHEERVSTESEAKKRAAEIEKTADCLNYGPRWREEQLEFSGGTKWGYARDTYGWVDADIYADWKGE